MKWSLLSRVTLYSCAILVSASAVRAQSTFKPPTPFEGGKVETFTPATEALKAVPVLPATTPGGAMDLEWSAQCDPMKAGTGVVSMRWQKGAALKTEQRVDISRFREGFDSGKYEATRALPPEQTSAAKEKADPGISYYWRVLTLTDAGWVPSTTYRFDAPTCPVDSAVDRQ